MGYCKSTRRGCFLSGALGVVPRPKGLEGPPAILKTVHGLNPNFSSSDIDGASLVWG